MGADLAALMRAAAADAEPSQAAMFPAGDDLPPLWSACQCGWLPLLRRP